MGAKKNAVIWGLAVFVGLLVAAIGGFTIFMKILELKGNRELINSNIWLQDMESGSLEKLTNDGYNIFPKYSRDGKKVAFFHRLGTETKATELKIYSLEKNQVLMILDDKTFKNNISWSPDDSKIYYLESSEETDIYMVEIQSKVKLKITNDELVESAPVLSPEGDWIAFLQEKGEIGYQIVIVPSGGGEKKIIIEHNGFVEPPRGIAWINNNQIAWHANSKVEVVDLEGNIIQRLKFEPMKNTYNFIYNSKVDQFYLKARVDPYDMDFSIIALDRTAGSIENKYHVEMMSDFDVATDGKTLVVNR